ncbi:hypothetical protein VUR80DRAFT_3780 [Thermomyces stellatus]
MEIYLVVFRGFGLCYSRLYGVYKGLRIGTTSRQVTKSYGNDRAALYDTDTMTPDSGTFLSTIRRYCAGSLLCPFSHGACVCEDSSIMPMASFQPQFPSPGSLATIYWHRNAEQRLPRGEPQLNPHPPAPHSILEATPRFLPRIPDASRRVTHPRCETAARRGHDGSPRTNHGILPPFFSSQADLGHPLPGSAGYPALLPPGNLMPVGPTLCWAEVLCGVSSRLAAAAIFLQGGEIPPFYAKLPSLVFRCSPGSPVIQDLGRGRREGGVWVVLGWGA